MIMTNHARFERADRLTYIAMTIGFGEPVLEHKENGFRQCITNTGVLMIKDAHEDVLITAFVCDMDKAIAIYKKSGYNRIPTKMYKTIVKNRVHIEKQNNVVY